jgi:hypothetical protein
MVPVHKIETRSEVIKYWKNLRTQQSIFSARFALLSRMRSAQ